MADVSHPLLVDLYELTMVDAYRRASMAERPATFSLFVRGLPESRSFLVAAGLDDCLEWFEHLHFGAEELAVLEDLDVFGPEFLTWLEGVRFTGNVRAVPEGTIVFGDEPILEVDAPIAEGQLAETFLLNQVTLQTSLATKAARCREAADGRSVVDFGLRRSHGIDSGMKLARIVGLVGLGGTSNVAGASRYGVPASGTMAHAFVQAHPDETDAFRTFAYAYGDSTILLVDTYDTPRGVDRAIEVAREMRADGVEVAGIRLDSGDLAELAREARRALDAAGFEDLRIVASGGLDEYVIQRLVEDGAPIDGFGVGTSLGVPPDAPNLDSVYKLVAYDGRPVLKTSTGKAIWPGPKQVWRAADWSHDVLALADEPSPDDADALLEVVMRGGTRTDAGRRTLPEANGHFEAQWAALPERIRRLREPRPHDVRVSPRLRRVAEELVAGLAETD